MHLQRAEPPPQGPARDRAQGVRALFVLGLVVVAALSSLLWWLIRHDPAEAPAQVGGVPAGESQSREPGEPTTEPVPTVQAGRFTFEGLAPVQRGESCDEVSYGKVMSWFGDHPCRRVVRGLFAARDGDARALVSVSVVTMPDSAQAQKLKALTDTSGTGNVSDLLRDGTADVAGAPQVAGGNYASDVSGDTVTIVESAFFGDTKNQALLDEITAEALQIAGQLGS